MLNDRSPLPPHARPTPAEAMALAGAALYLDRAGIALASLLLGRDDAAADAELAVTMRDQLLAGAALCRGLLDLGRTS
jgi:hypothetical protein